MAKSSIKINVLYKSKKANKSVNQNIVWLTNWLTSGLHIVRTTPQAAEEQKAYNSIKWKNKKPCTQNIQHMQLFTLYLDTFCVGSDFIKS